VQGSWSVGWRKNQKTSRHDVHYRIFGGGRVKRGNRIVMKFCTGVGARRNHPCKFRWRSAQRFLSLLTCVVVLKTLWPACDIIYLVFTAATISERLRLQTDWWETRGLVGQMKKIGHLWTKCLLMNSSRLVRTAHMNVCIVHKPIDIYSRCHTSYSRRIKSCSHW